MPVPALKVLVVLCSIAALAACVPGNRNDCLVAYAFGTKTEYDSYFKYQTTRGVAGSCL